jgi:putative transposase
LFAYIGGIIKAEGGTPDAIGGVADHMHILCGIPPRLAVSDLLRADKSSSSKWINDNRRSDIPFHWQRGFGAFTVSRSNLPEVSTYIARQDEHHRKLTFADELRALLLRHGIEFEERYLFDDEHAG